MNKPDVSDNPAQHYLYVIGGLAIIVGIIAAIIGGMNVVSTNPFSGTSSVSQIAVLAQGWGNGLAMLGALAVIGGAIAQAINWQRVNPPQAAHTKTYRELQQERDSE